MRKKVGTVLDDELLWIAKQAAARQKKSLSALLEQALRNHLAAQEKTRDFQERSLVVNTRGVLSISSRELRAVLREKMFYEA